MADALEFLDAQHEVFTTNEAAWKRDERRLFGGDAILTELARWKEEVETHYETRQREASWLNFPKIHASTLAGHLGRVAPMPDFGTLGQEVRSRKEARQNPTLAEQIFYNVDGIGADGSQWFAWMHGVQERAIATGHRWCLIEMPRAPTNPDGSARPRTREDEQRGHRPYLVEYSPVHVPMWEVSHGRLDWAVIRLRVPRADATTWEPLPKDAGYYLLVRDGYTLLGDRFAGGGWWLFDRDKQELAAGDWSKTGGAIPLVALIAETSPGTTEWPAISRSLTMELGQIAVSLMNRISERNFDASDAAKSVKYVLGADKDAFNLMVEFHEKNAMLVPVIGALGADGKQIIPTIYDGSTGAIPADVFTTIINSTIAEAHEVMVRQVSSGEDASGVSRDKAFGEATSPLLAGLAARRETFENAVLHFLELRAGAAAAAGSVTWPTEFELAPLLSKIERTIERMQKLGLRSPTLEAELLERAAVDDNLWPTDPATQEQARAELVAAGQAVATKAKGEAMTALTNAGVDLGFAAEAAGFTEEEVAAIVEGGTNVTGANDDRGQPPPPDPMMKEPPDGMEEPPGA